MVQPQLTEYISSQVKLGVSRQAIKSALVGAGWAETDVEDTLKKVEEASKLAAAAMPTKSVAAPQSVRMSDLISASAWPAAGSMASGALKKSDSKSEPPLDLAKAKMPKEMVFSPKAGGGATMKIVMGILILGLAGLAGFFYSQNSSLGARVAKVASESADVAARAATLNNQVKALTASTTALAAEVASLTAENAELRANLSFAAVPPISSGAPSSETVSISGRLTGGKSSFTLTTPYGVLVFVQNAKDAKVSAALTPLLTSTSSVALTGTHVPGSQNITVTAVNGSSL
jgi:hypothetical protein